MYIEFDPSDKNSSLGQYLKSLREEKEISIEELAETTKIKQDYLEAIEEDKYDVLPEGPYLQLFLKSYSEALDIPYDKLQSYLEAATSQAPSKAPKAKPAARPSKEVKPSQDDMPQTLKPVVDIHDKRKRQQGERLNGETKKYLMIIGAFVFLAFIAVILIIIFMAEPESSNQIEIENQLTPAELEQQRREQFLARYDDLSVSIYPASQQGFTISVDGRSPEMKLYSEEDTIREVADDSVFISMVKKDGSRIYLNGYIVLDTLDLVGKHDLIFTKTNWIDYVDTTITETEY
ncbi:MAG: helix-turn-helix domain-containing protein [candidate division Zixibacteria bacterium]|nr:helix-turn-helix domain-containing protein [candidate division Zixibacteria bacterium]NIR67925.1 helix-turn-helix domain-containing protein [candidate division Zixibacteria bacterium]NIS16288.1 helix-turn-helix domain-containing protein [candidate division Zixibacteria bacterium]NIS49142.1 helix-turn-helix domain-containing protein [candidate division Zixibacteria bacterium]NIT53650.1 helix-turn-helix domain-containing protein [candidate division Zixibacteria bacterium]